MYILVTKEGQVVMQGRNQAEILSAADDMADAGEAAVVAAIFYRATNSKGGPLVQGTGSWNAKADARLIRQWAHGCMTTTATSATPSTSTSSAPSASTSSTPSAKA